MRTVGSSEFGAKARRLGPTQFRSGETLPARTVSRIPISAHCEGRAGRGEIPPRLRGGRAGLSAVGLIQAGFSLMPVVWVLSRALRPRLDPAADQPRR